MAKRKRLDPARAVQPDPARAEAPLDKLPETLEVKSAVSSGFARTAPPIAHVAGAASSEAALARLSDEMLRAREEGRMVLSLPLEVIDRTHLVRDRIAVDEAEMQALMESIQTRGQQTPIEVVELDKGRYGLISGWRRIQALSRLRDATRDDRFGQVQALLRRPDSASDAYRAMVEENEIRVGLSYYERARIVARAAEMGVFDSVETALSSLFSSASRAKRSKIGSFIRLYSALDNDLKFAGAIPERLGLALIKAIEERDGFLDALRIRLDRNAPRTAQAELDQLQAALLQADTPARPDRSTPAALSLPDVALPKGLKLEAREGRLVLKGKAVTEALAADLAAWLASRG